MKDYLNKQFAKKLLIVGGIIYAISLILIFVTLFSLYGKTGQCLDDTTSCTLNTELILVKIATFIGYAGIGLFITGLILVLVVWMKKKK